MPQTLELEINGTPAELTGLVCDAFTLRRVSKGVKKFVIHNPASFIVAIANWVRRVGAGRRRATAQRTITYPKGGALVRPPALQIDNVSEPIPESFGAPAFSASAKTKPQKRKSPAIAGLSCKSWRETRDSNPGNAINVRRFSRPVHSTTLPISLMHHRIIVAHPVSAGAIIPE